MPHVIQRDARSDVFSAIAHPVRRQLLDLLVTGDQPVRSLAAHFATTRPAISQHLRILLDAGLVTERRAGRERHYRLQAERLQEVESWVRHYEGFWRQKLSALNTYLDTLP